MVLGEAGIQPVYTYLCSKEGDWDLVEDKKDDYSDVEWVLSSHDHSEQGQRIVEEDGCAVARGL